MKNFICSKCFVLVKQEKMPSSFNCGEGGQHQWKDMGEVGDTNYQCKKCSKILQSKKAPVSFNCSAGGQHQWKKM